MRWEREERCDLLRALTGTSPEETACVCVCVFACVCARVRACMSPQPLARLSGMPDPEGATRASLTCWYLQCPHFLPECLRLQILGLTVTLGSGSKLPESPKGDEVTQQLGIPSISQRGHQALREVSRQEARARDLGPEAFLPLLGPEAHRAGGRRWCWCPPRPPPET